jgi:APA family basic amino acid/polyamine antiporter
VTVISLLTVLSLVNAIMLMTPRILLAIGRDGFFTEKAAIVSKGARLGWLWRSPAARLRR